MRIIAKKQDVYDLQHSLFDESRTWVREEETFQIRVNKDSEAMIKRVGIKPRDILVGRDDSILSTPMLVGGELHWFHTMSMWYNGSFMELRTFDLTRVQALLDEHGKEMHTGFSGGNIKDVSQLAQVLRENESVIYRTLQTLNRPLVWIKGVTKSSTDDTKYLEVITNFNFHTYSIPWQEIDSNLYRFHQVIESYIWGVIGTGEKQTVEMSDLERLKAHGFDEKYSFRNRGK